MEPRDYAASVMRRWLWVVTTGLIGSVVGGLFALNSPTAYTATTSLYVAPALVNSSEGLGYAAQIGRVTLPSVLALSRSSAVLRRAAAELGSAATSQELARTVDVEHAPDSSLLTIAASAERPDDAAAAARAVASALQATSATVYRGNDGHALLRMTPVTPAQPPRVASSPQRGRDMTLGLAAGLLLAVLLCGLEELVRRRVRSVTDLFELTDLPVLATVGDGTRAGATPGQLDGVRLGWILALAGGEPGGPRRVGLLGDRRETRMLLRDAERGEDQPRNAATCAAPLSLVGLGAMAGACHGRPPGVDAVVVVVTQRMTRRALTRAVTAAQRLGVPTLGAVLHGGLPSSARWRHRLGAAVRGQASSWPARAMTPRLAAGGLCANPGPLVPVVALFLLGLDCPLPQRATTGLIVAVLLLPVWVAALPRFRGGRLLSLLTAAGLACGLLLARQAAADHSIDPHEMVATSFHLITALGLVGVVLWSRTRLSVQWIGLAYGAGRLAMALLASPGTTNAYKFELSIPLTIVVLSLTALSRRVLVPVAALALLAVLDIISDARSSFGFCVIAAALLLWQARRPAAGRHRVWSTALLLGGMGAGAYYAFTELLLVGALGSEVQARTARQIAQSGSLLLGGRPEWTATWALMRARPLGFGLGTVPAPSDVAVAKQGLAVTHIPYVGDYLTNYLLAGRVELHSILADLWSNTGPVGALTGLTMAALLVGACSALLSRRQLAALPAWATLSSLWFLGFGPLPSNLNDVAFTLGLVLLPALTARSRAPYPLRPRPPAAIPSRIPVPL